MVKEGAHPWDIICTHQSSNVEPSGGTVKVGSEQPQGAGGASPSNPPADSPESKGESYGS